MRFPEDVNDDVLKRLRRLEGQIRGVQRMIEEGQDCRDIVTQLSACKSALDRVGYRLVVAGMRHCAVAPEAGDQPVQLGAGEVGAGELGAGELGAGGLDADELERLFLKLS